MSDSRDVTFVTRKKKKNEYLSANLIFYLSSMFIACSA